MRVFIALEMPDDVRDKLRPCLSQLTREMREVKWVTAENLHLTIRFLGEVPTDHLAKIDNRLAAVAQHSAPFALRFERTGCFMNGGEPSVIWLGLEHNVQLRILANHVALESRTIVTSDDRKPFRPHITLGRVRQPYGGPPLQDALELINRTSLPDWSVEALSLIKSELTPRGPVYTILSRHHLGGE